MVVLSAFKLEAQYRDYVWGGRRLRPAQRTAEAWAVYGGDLITSGPLAGQTLAMAAARYGEALLGSHVMQYFGAGPDGSRFPLLIKLLDCADWLSLQVHPNDEQALLLEGLGHYGKTEAWHILQADPGAEILCGFNPGLERDQILQSVHDGSLLDYTRRLPLNTGDTVFIRAGTLHALGPGLLVYEVQQESDITYRAFDWNRPLSDGRKLHIIETLAVLKTEAGTEPIPPPPIEDGSLALLISCPYFTLRLLTSEHKPVKADPGGQTFHALTVIHGSVEVQGEGWSLPLAMYESAVIPASAGAYQVKASTLARVLVASVE